MYFYKSILISLILCLFIKSKSFAQTTSPDFAWGTQSFTVTPGNPDNAVAGQTALDNLGNIYVIGSFRGTKTIGTNMLTSQGGSNTFIAKYSQAGMPLGAFNIGSDKNRNTLDFTADNLGNTYICGYFDDTISVGNTTLLSSGDSDIFYAKFNAAGNLEWAKKLGGIGVDEGGSIASDQVGNVYITGTMDEYTIVGTDTSAQIHAFILKCNAAGNTVWIKSPQDGPPQGGITHGSDIHLDGGGNIYLHGELAGSAIFGNDTLEANDLSVFVAKYDASGNSLWGRNTVGPGQHQADWNTFAVDATGNSYMLGSSDGGNITFGNVTLTSALQTAMHFIAKFNSSGTIQWAKPYVYGSYEGIATDDLGNHYEVASNGNIVKHDAAGNPEWTKVLTPTSGYCNPKGIKGDNIGNIFITGQFSGSSTFGNSVLNSNYKEAFLAKLYASTTGISESAITSELNLSPNPNNGTFKLEFPNLQAKTAEIQITDLTGRTIYTEQLKTFHNSVSETINLKAPKGIYLLRLTANDQMITRKIIIN